MKHSLAAQMQTTLAPVVKKRVAAYARVSTEHEEQQTSYDAQVDYYTQKIKERKPYHYDQTNSKNNRSLTRVAVIFFMAQ